MHHLIEKRELLVGRLIVHQQGTLFVGNAPLQNHHAPRLRPAGELECAVLLGLWVELKGFIAAARALPTVFEEGALDQLFDVGGLPQSKQIVDVVGLNHLAAPAIQLRAGFLSAKCELSSTLLFRRRDVGFKESNDQKMLPGSARQIAFRAAAAVENVKALYVQRDVIMQVLGRLASAQSDSEAALAEQLA